MTGNLRKLSKIEFDILSSIEESPCSDIVLFINRQFKYDVQEISSVINTLCNCCWVSENGITNKGLEVLERYRVKRAVVLAAGNGTRLLPITINTPKPLVKVNGKRIIDTIIDAFIAADIKEVYIVTGYLEEQFELLLHKYPFLKLISNPYYNTTNNISSAYVACQYFQNAYVMEADLIIQNSNLIKKYQYESNFLGVPIEETDDWCFIVKDGFIVDSALRSQLGEVDKGSELYLIRGIGYWTAEDGAMLEKDIKTIFETPDGKQKFWGRVPLSIYKNKYHPKIRFCSLDDITEIDTFNELKVIDKSYDVI